jgi:glycosyltransferase involved in cell wall biosynthesis
MTIPRPDRPYLSVIMPVHNGAAVLPRSLEALAASDMPRDSWELIVVDDASTDDTALIAARYADTVVRLPGKPHGPAYARNRGFEVSRGENIVFLDSDVCVHRDTLRRFASVFYTEPDVSAVFGSYDDDPPAPGWISQYRNLLHHWVHQENGGDAETFWAGLGAIRRPTFVDAGMYDEWHFPRPQVEDIELGHRIRALGARIVLRPEIQATHLKRWTLRNVIATDMRDRGVPWMRLLVHQGATVRTRTLNLRTREKINTALVWLAVLFALASVLWSRGYWIWGTAASLSLVLLFSAPLYAFFLRRRGLLFLVAAIPMHLMYYLLNGVSAALGWLLHQLFGAPRPDPAIEAYHELGVKMWPPVPNKRQFGARHTPVSRGKQ